MSQSYSEMLEIEKRKRTTITTPTAKSHESVCVFLHSILGNTHTLSFQTYCDTDSINNVFGSQRKKTHSLKRCLDLPCLAMVCKIKAFRKCYLHTHAIQFYFVCDNILLLTRIFICLCVVSCRFRNAVTSYQFD